MLLKRSDGSITYYASPLLDAVGVPHAFSTRAGGVSPAPFDSLNLGLARDADLKDDPANVEENNRRLIAAIGCGGRDRCWVSQVHAADVCAVRPGAKFDNGPRADALVTDDPARVISIKYADCVPILLATADGRAVAAVHAGWRGLVAGVIRAAVTRLTELTGSPGADLIAAIGPCIGPDAFEVGPEVAAEFRRAFGPEAPLKPGHGDRSHASLPCATVLQLVAAGVNIARIDTTDRCTYAAPADFFSHRREGPATGRMAAIISVRA
jgi:YfiH family protein